MSLHLKTRIKEFVRDMVSLLFIPPAWWKCPVENELENLKRKAKDIILKNWDIFSKTHGDAAPYFYVYGQDYPYIFVKCKQEGDALYFIGKKQIATLWGYPLKYITKAIPFEKIYLFFILNVIEEVMYFEDRENDSNLCSLKYSHNSYRDSLIKQIVTKVKKMGVQFDSEHSIITHEFTFKTFLKILKGMYFVDVSELEVRMRDELVIAYYDKDSLPERGYRERDGAEDFYVEELIRIKECIY